MEAKETKIYKSQRQINRRDFEMFNHSEERIVREIAFEMMQTIPVYDLKKLLSINIIDPLDEKCRYFSNDRNWREFMTDLVNRNVIQIEAKIKI